MDSKTPNTISGQVVSEPWVLSERADVVLKRFVDYINSDVAEIHEDNTLTVVLRMECEGSSWKAGPETLLDAEALSSAFGRANAGTGVRLVLPYAGAEIELNILVASCHKIVKYQSVGFLFFDYCDRPFNETRILDDFHGAMLPSEFMLKWLSCGMDASSEAIEMHLDAAFTPNSSDYYSHSHRAKYLEILHKAIAVTILEGTLFLDHVYHSDLPLTDEMTARLQDLIIEIGRRSLVMSLQETALATAEAFMGLSQKIDFKHTHQPLNEESIVQKPNELSTEEIIFIENNSKTMFYAVKDFIIEVSSAFKNRFSLVRIVEEALDAAGYKNNGMKSVDIARVIASMDETLFDDMCSKYMVQTQDNLIEFSAKDTKRLCAGMLLKQHNAPTGLSNQFILAWLNDHGEGILPVTDMVERLSYFMQISFPLKLDTVAKISYILQDIRKWAQYYLDMGPNLNTSENIQFKIRNHKAAPTLAALVRHIDECVDALPATSPVTDQSSKENKMQVIKNETEGRKGTYTHHTSLGWVALSKVYSLPVLEEHLLVISQIVRDNPITSRTDSSALYQRVTDSVVAILRACVSAGKSPDFVYGIGEIRPCDLTGITKALFGELNAVLAQSIGLVMRTYSVTGHFAIQIPNEPISRGHAIDWNPQWGLLSNTAKEAMKETVEEYLAKCQQTEATKTTKENEMCAAETHPQDSSGNYPQQQSQTTEENTVKNEETPVTTLRVNSVEFTIKPDIGNTITAFLQNTIDSPGNIADMVVSNDISKTKPVGELLTEISETVDLILDMSKNKGVKFITINGNMFEVNSGWHARLKRLPEAVAKAKSLMETSMNDLKEDKSVNAKAVQFLNSCDGLKIGFVEKQEICDAVAKQLIDFYGLPLDKLGAVIDSVISTCQHYLSMSPNEWEGREASSEIPILIRKKIVYIHSALCAIKSKMEEPTMNTKTGSISAELESILRAYVYYCREVKSDLTLAGVKAVTYQVLTHGTFSSMSGWKAVADAVEAATVEQVYEAYVNVSGNPIEGREPLLKLMKYFCGIVSVSNSMDILMSAIPAGQTRTFGFLPGGQTPGQHNSPFSGFQAVNPFAPQAGMYQPAPWNYGGNSRTGQGPVNVGTPDLNIDLSPFDSVRNAGGYDRYPSPRPGRDSSMEALEHRLTALIQDMNNLKLSRATGYMAHPAW